MVEHIIIDDYLSEGDYTRLHKDVWEGQMPFYLHRGVSSSWNDGMKMSCPLIRDSMVLIEPPESVKNLMSKLPGFYMPARMHVNMTFKNNVPDQPYHQDQYNPFLYAAVYYLTHTNGATVFENGDSEEIEVESIANRMVIFRACEKHKVKGHTEGPTERIIFNMNYLPSEDFLAKE